MKPTTLIIRTAGTNCDRELVHAFEMAGARTVLVHLNQILKSPTILESADIIGFPGGFSYGDDIASGRIFASRLRLGLLEPLKAAVARRVPMIGVCNGFQVLVKLGLLPEPDANRQTATLSDNSSGRFTDKWVSLEPVEKSVCIWTKGLSSQGHESFDVPIAHGEGRFVVESPEVLARLKSQGQIALRYSRNASASFPGNPNGSTDDIAGVCDPSGLILGLMPHPERFLHPTNHPLWTRKGPEWLRKETAGFKVFVNAVEFVKASTPVAVVAGA